MEIIALQEYTDKYVSLYEGQIRNIADSIAQKLIEQGIVAEHSDGENSGKNNLVILPFTRIDNTIITTLTYSDIIDIYAKYQSGDVVALTIDDNNRRITLFITDILYQAAGYGYPERYIVLAAGIHSLADQYNTFVYLTNVTFYNGAETTANITVKRISLTS